jgi:aryl-alcohol dehydrogenase-like predicted oxidoreductase
MEASMKYRHLGRTGIQVSELSLGSWITFNNQVDVDAAVEIMAAAYEAGVNFFDNAEAYAQGKSEEVMGAALKKLGWRRGSYLVTTKIYWGLQDGVNEKNTLNRKRLIEAINGSLERLQLDYVDVLYCHRPDKNTPILETVWARLCRPSRLRSSIIFTSLWWNSPYTICLSGSVFRVNTSASIRNMDTEPQRSVRWLRGC